MELPRNPWNDLKRRSLSALALSALAFGGLWLGGFAFSVLVISASLLLKAEWDALIHDKGAAWRAFGYAYLALPTAALLWLRGLHGFFGDTGFYWCLWLVLAVAATDIGAYFCGRLFGRHALAPAISPKKTWEGLAGGVCAAMAAGGCLAPHIAYPRSLFGVLGASALLAVVAQAGDLFQSYVKRQAGVKDSGALLPGHGGLLDRLDGYLFAAPCLALLLYGGLW